MIVVGDNYKNSYDSRTYGTISQEQVSGKVLFHT
ncbi:MAG: S26 family signal peptidase [Mycoplasmatales bacterium]